MPEGLTASIARLGPSLPALPLLRAADTGRKHASVEQWYGSQRRVSVLANKHDETLMHEVVALMQTRLARGGLAFPACMKQLRIGRSVTLSAVQAARIRPICHLDMEA